MVKSVEKSEAMFRLIGLWRSSGRSKKSFCLEQGINIHTFTYWIEKIERTNLGIEAPSGFVRLTSGSSGLELRFPKGATVELRAGMSSAEIILLQSLIY